MAYDAFISYSHGEDSALAESVQRGLQRLARPWYRRSALKVFRDSTALSANPGLWSSITAAMEDSSALIVLCSPEAAASPWVDKEIEHWRASRPDAPIIPVLAAGDLIWNGASGSFDLAQSTALNPPLRSAFTEEPLFVDLRWARHGADVKDPQFRSQIADIAAPLHGIPKDELVGEDLRQHRRALRLAWGAAVGLLLLSIATIAGATQAVSNANARVDAERSLTETQRLVESAKKDLAATQAETAAAKKAKQQAEKERQTAREAAEASETKATQAEKRATDSDAEAVAAADRAIEADAKAVEADGRAADAQDAASAAQDEATRSRQVADGARTAADLSRAEAERAKGNEERALQTEARALSAERVALTREAEATARLNDAVVREQIARAGEQEAKRAEEEATKRAKEASDRARLAEERTATAEAGLASTRLATAALSASERGDRALLLAAAATQVPGDEGVAGLDALMAVNARTRGVLGFLHFVEDGPTEMAHVTASPSGRFVAAAESDESIRLAGDPGSVYVWVGADDPRTARAVALPRPFRCLDAGEGIEGESPRLKWLIDGLLMTVESLPEEPGSCDGAVVASTTQGVEYTASRVSVWDVTAAPPQEIDLGELLDPEGGVTAVGQATGTPVRASEDGSRLWVTFDLGDRTEIGAPVPYSLVWNLRTGRLELMNAWPADDLGGETFSSSGRYASTVDLARGPVVLDLDAWTEDSARCPLGGTPGFRGCFPATVPVPDLAAPTAVVSSPPVILPADNGFALERLDRRGMVRFDITTGRFTGASPLLDSSAWSLHAGTERVAATMADGSAFTAPWGSTSFVELPLQAQADCFQRAQVPEMPGHVMIVQSCAIDAASPGGEDLRRTRVFRVSGGGPKLVQDVVGTPVHSDAEGALVVENVALLPDRGARWGFQALELSSTGGRLLGQFADRRPIIAPDGSRVAAVKPNEVYAAAATVEVVPLHGRAETVSLPGSNGVFSAAFSGSRLIGVGRSDGTDPWAVGVIWDATNRTPDFAEPTRLEHAIFRDDSAACPPPQDCGVVAAVSADGTLRAVARDANRVEVVDLTTGSGRSVTAPGAVDFVRFTRNVAELQLRIALQSGETFVVRVRSNGADLPALSGTLLPELVVDSSADGTRLLSADPDGRHLVVRDATDLREIGRLDGSAEIDMAVPHAFAMSTSGARVAGTDESGRTVVWSTATGAAVVRFDPPSQVIGSSKERGIGVQFRPDGRELAVKTADQRVLVWTLDDAGSGAYRGAVRLPKDAWAWSCTRPMVVSWRSTAVT